MLIFNYFQRMIFFNLFVREHQRKLMLKKKNFRTFKFLFKLY